jgi:hypothetical protein
MAKGKKPTIPAPPSPPAKYTEQDFFSAYTSLCKRMGWQIVGRPALRHTNDLGGSLIIVELGIAPYMETKNGN